jgi:hypothetical protein
MRESLSQTGSPVEPTRRSAHTESGGLPFVGAVENTEL